MASTLDLLCVRSLYVVVVLDRTRGYVEKDYNSFILLAKGWITMRKERGQQNLHGPAVTHGGGKAGEKTAEPFLDFLVADAA